MYDPFAPETGPLPGRHRSSLQRGNDIDTLDQSQEPVSLISLKAHRTMNVLFFFFIGLLVILLGRLVQLQVVQGNNFRLRSEGNRLRSITTPAPRGAIVDRSGQLLADNVPNIVLTIIPADLPKDAAKREMMIARISQTTGVAVVDIQTALQSKQRRSTDPITLREHIPYDEAMRMIISTAGVTPINVVSLPNRSYPDGLSTSSFLGYTGRISPADLEKQPEKDPLDIVGKTGLERYYNDTLMGVDGVREVERDVQNREQRVISQREPVPGKTVVTTIDLGLQRVLADKLQAMVKSMRSPGGAAVALDPNTGEVLAMVSAPTYDNNWFVTSGHSDDITTTLTSPKKPLLNRVISGQYPSGSIIKPLIASAALAERIITASSTVLSVGGFKVGNDFFPDWKAGGHGVTNVSKAIAESVNTFFYAVGGGYENISGLGVDRIVDYLQRFGWGKTLGIDLPSEADGFLPTKDWRSTKRASPWKLGDTYHISIGQGDIEVTPLQIGTAISAVANGGTLYQPHLVGSVKSADGVTEQTIAPHAISDQVVNASVLATVRSGMREGVLSGSSRSLQSLPVTSAGKTGTAQFGNEGKTHSWYAAFAPYEHPRIVIVVLVEAGGEGNAAALPVAKDALQWYFTEGQGRPETP